MPCWINCMALDRFGRILKPFWDPENVSGHSKAPFFEDLGSKKTPIGTYKSPWGPQGHHLNLQSVSWKRVFLDLRLHYNLAPRITRKIWPFQDVRHGWNIANSISEPHFPCFLETLVLALFRNPFLTPLGTHLAPEVVTVGAKWLTEAPEKVPEQALWNRLLSELWKWMETTGNYRKLQETTRNYRNSCAPRVRSETKVYLTGKTYD